MYLNLYKSCSRFSVLRSYVNDEVQARQQLNAELAMTICEERNYDWLVHIDIDELFYISTKSVKEHFAMLCQQNINQVIV